MEYQWLMCFRALLGFRGRLGTTVAVLVGKQRDMPLRQEGSMKMQKLVCLQMLMGLGAALLLAATTQAQQKVDPASYDSETGTAQEPNPDNSEGLVSTALGTHATKEEAELARVMLTEVVILFILMAGVALIVLYAAVATRRSQQLQPILSNSMTEVSYGPASGASTH
jgi:hypothetical protein